MFLIQTDYTFTQKNVNEYVIGSGTVRLVGDNEGEGHVEVLRWDTSYTYYEWRSLCHTTWNSRNAIVTCRQLGYLTGEAGMIYGIPDGALSYWTDHIDCDGTEYSVEDCFTDETEDNCDFTKAATVKCYIKTGV